MMFSIGDDLNKRLNDLQILDAYNNLEHFSEMNQRSLGSFNFEVTKTLNNL